MVATVWFCLVGFFFGRYCCHLELLRGSPGEELKPDSRSSSQCRARHGACAYMSITRHFCVGLKEHILRALLLPLFARFKPSEHAGQTVENLSADHYARWADAVDVPTRECPWRDADLLRYLVCRQVAVEKSALSCHVEILGLSRTLIKMDINTAVCHKQEKWQNRNRGWKDECG
jgi:hypothetical protein